MPLARVDTVAGVAGALRAAVRNLHTDHLGTPREITDAEGRVVWAARYRVRFRFYDPGIGRFVSVDPIGLAGGANIYRYVPSSIGWADPLGLSPCPSGGNGAAAGELGNLTLSKRHFLGNLSIPKATANSLFVGEKTAAMADLAEIQSGAALRTGGFF